MRKTRFFLIFSILYMVNTRTERLKLEKSLLNDYGKGVYISPEQHQQDVMKKRLDKSN